MRADRPDIRVLPASRGLAWVAGALGLLRRQPARLLLIGLVLQFLMGFSRVGMLALLLILAIPAFSAGMMQVMMLVDRGARPPLSMLFVAFSSGGRLLRLVALGALMLAGGILALMVVLSGNMGAFDPALLARLEAGDITALDSIDPALIRRLMLAMLAGLVVSGSISYFAVPLVWFTDRPLGLAIVTGLRGMVRNWRAFLVLGLVFALLAFPVATLTGLLLTASTAGTPVSPVFTVLMLVLAVAMQLVLFGAQYVSFTEIFDVRQAPGPAGGEDGQLVA